MSSLIFMLPWPEACLAQNSRGHWASSAFRKKKARVVAKRLTATALKRTRLIRCDTVRLTLVFHQPELKRARDMQNVFGAMKYAVDGIADAIGIDDSKFEWGAPAWGEPCEGGAVQVTIEPIKGPRK